MSSGYPQELHTNNIQNKVEDSPHSRLQILKVTQTLSIFKYQSIIAQREATPGVSHEYDKIKNNMPRNIKTNISRGTRYAMYLNTIQLH